MPLFSIEKNPMSDAIAQQKTPTTMAEFAISKVNGVFCHFRPLKMANFAKNSRAIAKRTVGI